MRREWEIFSPSVGIALYQPSVWKSASQILKCPEHIFQCKTLLISFKDYATFELSEILTGIESNSWEKIASIAIPYAESIQNLFLGDVSRIGTPYTSNQSEELEWAKIFLNSNKNE